MLKDVEYAFFAQLSYLNWNNIVKDNLNKNKGHVEKMFLDFLNDGDIWTSIKTPQHDINPPQEINEILMYNEEDKRLFGVYGTELDGYKNTVPTFNFDGWQFIYSADSVKLHKDFHNKDDIVPNNDFFACAFMKDDDIVIAYRGTDNFRDDFTSTNIPIGRGYVPFQFIDTALFYEYILREFGENKNIHFTGHSLGGCLAQSAYVYSGKKHQTVTWNGLGFGDSFEDIDIAELKGIIEELYKLNYKLIIIGERALNNQLAHECKELLKSEITKDKVKELLENQLKFENEKPKLKKDIYRLTLLLQTISKYIKHKGAVNDNIKNYYTAYDLTPNIREKTGVSIEVLGVTTEIKPIERKLKSHHNVNDFLLYMNEETGNIEVGKLNTTFTKNLVKTVFNYLKKNDKRLEIFVDDAKESTNKDKPFFSLHKFACKYQQFGKKENGISKAKIKYVTPAKNSFPCTSELDSFIPYEAFTNGEGSAHGPNIIGSYTLGHISNVTLGGITGGKEDFLLKEGNPPKEKTDAEKKAELKESKKTTSNDQTKHKCRGFKGNGKIKDYYL